MEFRATLGSSCFNGSLGPSDAANVAEGDAERHDGGVSSQIGFQFRTAVRRESGRAASAAPDLPERRGKVVTNKPACQAITYHLDGNDGPYKNSPNPLPVNALSQKVLSDWRDA
jgi:hypothetical protein